MKMPRIFSQLSLNFTRLFRNNFTLQKRRSEKVLICFGCDILGAESKNPTASSEAEKLGIGSFPDFRLFLTSCIALITSCVGLEPNHIIIPVMATPQ